MLGLNFKLFWKSPSSCLDWISVNLRFIHVPAVGRRQVDLRASGFSETIAQHPRGPSLPASGSIGPVAPGLLHPNRCTDPASEHPVGFDDSAGVGLEEWDLFGVEGTDYFVEDHEDPFLHPELYEPSDHPPESPGDSGEHFQSTPFDHSSWKRFAESEIIQTQVKRLRLASAEGSLTHSFLSDTPGTMLNSMFSIPDPSLSMLLEPMERLEPEVEIEAKEKLYHARRVRVSKTDDDLRDASITKLQKIVLTDPAATRLGELLVPTSSRPLDEREVRRSLEQAFSRKSSGTLYKRACSLSRYIDWYGRLNRRGSPLRIKEFDIYSYLGHLEDDRAGATSASGFIEALRFLDGVAVFIYADLQKVLSPRVLGYAHQQFLRKAPLQQKDPIQCGVVEELEKLLLRKTDTVQVCILGQLLWCFHSASRWSDSLKLQSLTLEKSKDVTLVVGEALGSKTSLTKEAKTRLIPYVAIGTGISGLNWAESWLDARVSEFGCETEPFLPSFSCRTGRWATTPMSSTEACGYLQDLVAECLLTMDPKPKMDLRNLGTHSLKTGLLTMAARSTIVKFSMAERRILGHHIKPGDKSILTYSRESYTGIYGKILACFMEIQAGNFHPDMSAVERILETAEAVASGSRPHESQALAEVEHGVDTLDDPWEISSESSEEQADLVEEVAREEAVTGRTPFPGGQDLECIVHRKSGIVHCLLTSDMTRCGRHLSPNYVALDQTAIEDMECCILCGRHLAAHQD